LTDEHRPSLIERARAGDWDAIEDLVAGTVAPTFDAALHVFGDPKRAEAAAEDALLALLIAVRGREIEDGDPLRATGRSLAEAAAAAKAGPFAEGLTPDDLVLIGLRPDEARRGALTGVAAADRVAAILAFALGLEPADLAWALGRSRPDAEAAVLRVLDAIPHARPAEALRDILDARAASTRVPPDLEEHVLDRYEKS
jgi:hypothetical protein